MFNELGAIMHGVNMPNIKIDEKIDNLNFN